MILERLGVVAASYSYSEASSAFTRCTAPWPTPISRAVSRIPGQSRLPLAVYVASDSGGAVLTDGFGDLSGWRWERSADSFRDAYGQADIHPWHGSSSSACLGWIHAIITGKVDRPLPVK
jgi:hypothetical protein